MLVNRSNSTNSNAADSSHLSFAQLIVLGFALDGWVGNCKAVSVEELLVRLEMLKVETRSASMRWSSSWTVGQGIATAGIGCIVLIAFVTLVEKVPFMLVKVKWEVNPDQ